MIRFVRSFGAFWWDFIIGDDWTAAVGIVVALAVTWLLAHHHLPAWWLLPVAVLTIIALSLVRARRAARPAPARADQG